MNSLKTLLFVVGACSLLCPSAGADWLVMKDGSRVEARDGWDVRGQRVVFTSTAGTLSMVRLAEVDMAATEEANAAEASPRIEPAAAAPEARQPVLVLTDADIPRAQIEEKAVAAKALPAVADRQPVQVVSWQERELPGGGLELRGVVRNTGQHMASDITVRADIKDPGGDLVTEGTAFLGADVLMAGTTTTFRLMLPDIDDLPDSPIFTVSSDSVALGQGRAKMASVDPLGYEEELEELPAAGDSQP